MFNINKWWVLDATSSSDDKPISVSYNENILVFCVSTFLFQNPLQFHTCVTIYEIHILLALCSSQPSNVTFLVIFLYGIQLYSCYIDFFTCMSLNLQKQFYQRIETYTDRKCAVQCHSLNDLVLTFAFTLLQTEDSYMKSALHSKECKRSIQEAASSYNWSLHEAWLSFLNKKSKKDWIPGLSMVNFLRPACKVGCRAESWFCMETAIWKEVWPPFLRHWWL